MRHGLSNGRAEPVDPPPSDPALADQGRAPRIRRRRAGAGALLVSTLGLAGLALLPGGRDGSPPVDGETGAEAVDVGRDPEWGKGPLLPRVAPSVVWTGREVIVSGGFSDSASGSGGIEHFEDGAAFDPATGRWRRIADRPEAAMTWTASAWTGERVLVIGAGGDLSYDPVVDAWRSLPDPPFRLPDLVSDNERFEAAWSGDVFYVWRPASDEMALYDPEVDRWEPMSAPGLDSDPVALLADGERLVALGTGWPGGAAPVSLDVDSAEWRNGRWVRNEPMTFATASQQSAADVGAAALVGGSVVVWGDGGAEAGPTYLLGPDGGRTPAPPMPIEAGLGHPGSVPLGDRLLALSEGPDAAIYDPETRAWTVAVLAAAGENGADRGPGIRADGAVWTGSELLAWTGSGLFRWSPPEAGSPGSPGSSAAGDAGP